MDKVKPNSILYGKRISGFIFSCRKNKFRFFCSPALQETQIALDLPGYRRYLELHREKRLFRTQSFQKREPLPPRTASAPQSRYRSLIALEYDSFFTFWPSVTLQTPGTENGGLPYRSGMGRCFPPPCVF